jgi:hypothetical protein
MLLGARKSINSDGASKTDILGLVVRKIDPGDRLLALLINLEHRYVLRAIVGRGIEKRRKMLRKHVLEKKVIHYALLTKGAVKGGINARHSTRGIDNCLGISYSYSYTREFKVEGESLKLKTKF